MIFRLQDVHGKDWSLSTFLSGKRGAVVLFWSGVCSHCIRYDGYLNSFEQRHPELALVALASRNGETREQIRKPAPSGSSPFRFCMMQAAVTAPGVVHATDPRAFLIDGNRTSLYRLGNR